MADNAAVNIRQRLDALKAALWSERSNYEAHWRDIADYLCPRRVRWFTGDRNRGDRRSQKIIDSTAVFALNTLRAGMHAGLTSPARPWFKLDVFDPDLAELQAVKEWLFTTTQRMQAVFEYSNIYQVLPIVYGDMGAFATAAMSEQRDPLTLCRFYAYPVGSYGLAMDERGLVSTFVREWQMTVRQIVSQYARRPESRRDIDWTRVSPAIKNLWDQGSYETPIDVIWAVLPNDDADPTRLGPRAMPFASYVYEVGASSGQMLETSGYESMPVYAPRWDITGEDTYGTNGPAMMALGDIKQLQLMQKVKAKAIQKQVDPPLKAAPELRTQKTSLLSADITYVRDPGANLMPLHEVAINLADLREDIAQTQYRIQRCFHEDLFLMMARADDRLGASRPTATEVRERHEEKLLALGPVLERTEDELLGPIIDRTFEMMDRAGMLPDPPQELSGVKLRVAFTSILAEAQKLVSVVAQDRFAGAVGPIISVAPETLDVVDTDQLTRDYARNLGVNPKVVRPPEDVEARRKQRQQAQAAADQAQQAAVLAKAARDASGAQINNDSMLDQIVRGVTPGPSVMPA